VLSDWSRTILPLRHFVLGDWSSGMILALGARGREFDSRITPFCLFGCQSVAGVTVSIAAFQAVDPGSIPGPRIC
jgi:hypothetical protein